MSIEPKEAEIVKRMYLEYLEGESLVEIGKSMEKDGTLTAVEKTK